MSSSYASASSSSSSTIRVGSVSSTSTSSTSSDKGASLSLSGTVRGLKFMQRKEEEAHRLRLAEEQRQAIVKSRWVAQPRTGPRVTISRSLRPNPQKQNSSSEKAAVFSGRRSFGGFNPKIAAASEEMMMTPEERERLRAIREDERISIAQMADRTSKFVGLRGRHAEDAASRLSNSQSSPSSKKLKKERNQKRSRSNTNDFNEVDKSTGFRALKRKSTSSSKSRSRLLAS